MPQRPLRPPQAVNSLAWVQASPSSSSLSSLSSGSSSNDSSNDYESSKSNTSGNSNNNGSDNSSSSLGYEDANTGGALLTAGADGTARLWQCRTRCYFEDFKSPSSSSSSKKATKAAGTTKTITKSAGGAGAKGAGGGSDSGNNTTKLGHQYRWRSPLCVGQLNSHLPQSIPLRNPPLPQGEVGGGGEGVNATTTSGAELPWLFGGEIEKSSQSSSDSTPSNIRSKVEPTTAAEAAIDAEQTTVRFSQLNSFN